MSNNVSALGWIIVIFNIALAIDAARRPASVWAAADRQKTWWVTLLVIFGFVAFIPYVIGVLPRLMQAGRESTGTPFQKRSANPFEKS